MILVTTTETIAGRKTARSLGEVSGIAVRSRGFGCGIKAFLRRMRGSDDMSECAILLEVARQQAVERLKCNAANMGANAVVAMRFDASAISDAITEIVAYGTAVFIEEEKAV